MKLRLRALALAPLALALAACSGPLTPSPVEGEPVCPDFELVGTHTKMRGSLRFPVTVTILDGDKQLYRATLDGLRTKDEPGTRILIPDDNAEVTVQWAQCENERAPLAATLTRESKDAPPYECGKGEVYKTDQLVTKRGDAASRTLKFPAPPKPECWMGEPPKQEPPPAPAAADAGTPEDAGAPDAGAEDAAAQAATDVGPGDAGAAAADAGPGDAGAGAADAGGQDAGKTTKEKGAK